MSLNQRNDIVGSACLNAEIDDECLILLGKVFQAVITLGTKDEYIY